MRDDTSNQLLQITVSERRGAQMIDVSPRLFRQLMERGEITPVRIPGVRRVLYDVDELRATVQRWKRETV